MCHIKEQECNRQSDKKLVNHKTIKHSIYTISYFNQNKKYEKYIEYCNLKQSVF